jgi:hypothetical protein
MKYPTADGSDQDAVLSPILDVMAEQKSLAIQMATLEHKAEYVSSKLRDMTRDLTKIQLHALDGVLLRAGETPRAYFGRGD